MANPTCQIKEHITLIPLLTQLKKKNHNFESEFKTLAHEKTCLEQRLLASQNEIAELKIKLTDSLQNRNSVRIKQTDNDLMEKSKLMYKENEDLKNRLENTSSNYDKLYQEYRKLEKKLEGSHFNGEKIGLTNKDHDKKRIKDLETVVMKQADEKEEFLSEQRELRRKVAELELQIKETNVHKEAKVREHELLLDKYQKAILTLETTDIELASATETNQQLQQRIEELEAEKRKERTPYDQLYEDLLKKCRDDEDAKLIAKTKTSEGTSLELQEITYEYNDLKSKYMEMKNKVIELEFHSFGYNTIMENSRNLFGKFFAETTDEERKKSAIELAQMLGFDTEPSYEILKDSFESMLDGKFPKTLEEFRAALSDAYLSETIYVLWDILILGVVKSILEHNGPIKDQPPANEKSPDMIYAKQTKRPSRSSNITVTDNEPTIKKSSIDFITLD